VSRRVLASRCCASSVPSRPTSVAPTVGRAAAAAIPSSSVDFPEPFSPTKQVTRAERSSDGMVAMADTENGNAGSPGGGPCFKPTVRRWGTALIDAAGRARSQRRGGVGHGGVPFEVLTTPSRRAVLTLLATLAAPTPAPAPAEIRKVTEAMRTDILRVEQYPTISFTSKTVTAVDSGFRLVAELTLAGQTREVPVDVRVAIGSDTLRAWASFAVKQTDFGIKPIRGGPAGTVRDADRVTFAIEAVAVRVP